MITALFFFDTKKGGVFEYSDSQNAVTVKKVTKGETRLSMYVVKVVLFTIMIFDKIHDFAFIFFSMVSSLSTMKLFWYLQKQPS